MQSKAECFWQTPQRERETREKRKSRLRCLKHTNQQPVSKFLIASHSEHMCDLNQKTVKNVFPLQVVLNSSMTFILLSISEVKLFLCLLQ